MKRWVIRSLIVLASLAATSNSVRAAEPVLNVAKGFKVERVLTVSKDTQGSWVSLCADERGVMYASDQYGPLYRIELPAGKNAEVSVREVKLPIGGVHGFRNESGEPASMLLLFTPGAPREDYFETLADAARRDAMGEDDWTAFFLRHDTFWVDGA